MQNDTSTNFGSAIPVQHVLLLFYLLIALLFLLPACSFTEQTANNQALAPIVDHEEVNAVDQTEANKPPAIPLDLSADLAEQPVTDKISDENTASEPEQTVSLEVEQLKNLGEWEEGQPEKTETPAEVSYDFPVTINRHVQFYLDFFQNEDRNNFQKWLSRSGRYLPMIQEELRKADMPLDLVYLPMIESGYSLTAYSSARAVGPWQFIRSTGRLYGLTINSDIDERRDPIKSTKAAIAFLQDLYQEFNSWPLAVAAYNAGGGRIRSAIRRAKSNNFWDIAKGNYLKLETKRYVPKLIAAIIIAKNPEKYGFTDIEYLPPLNFETIDVPRWTSLQAVAVACDESFEDIRDLNRQLSRAITPPSTPTYQIKVPEGKKEQVAANLSRVNATVTTSFKTHAVKSGETITQICRRYNLNKTTLLKANNLRSASLKTGQRLRIPYKSTSYQLLDENNIATRLGPARISPENLVLHKVQRGETIYELSQRYGVPIHMIAAWNDIQDIRRINVGQQLAFYLKDLTGTTPALQEEETTIVMLDNQSSTKTTRQDPSFPGKTTHDERLTYYNVQTGDSLWAISKKFQVSPEEIRLWNKLDGDTIYPGNRLLLKIASDMDV
ncbi:MAG: LysM peptidoglycan-binding domain-containing protein [Proteobacteria bacterium]|nr:LysM peptidoglycan-binding domain-containing protein [Pseudomonadota bacterium]MBU1715817.1 LysM peptidoglycan-binding domain-containing protein [Pseudomonadota bacterium]